MQEEVHQDRVNVLFRGRHAARRRGLSISASAPEQKQEHESIEASLSTHSKSMCCGQETGSAPQQAQQVAKCDHPWHAQGEQPIVGAVPPLVPLDP